MLLLLSFGCTSVVLPTKESPPQMMMTFGRSPRFLPCGLRLHRVCQTLSFTWVDGSKVCFGLSCVFCLGQTYGTGRGGDGVDGRRRKGSREETAQNVTKTNSRTAAVAGRKRGQGRVGRGYGLLVDASCSMPAVVGMHHHPCSNHKQSNNPIGGSNP